MVATVPAGKRWVLTNLILTNFETGVTAATLTSVRLDGIYLFQDLSLNPAAVFTLDCAQVLEAGDTIQAWANDISAVALHASGVEMDA
ncbi:hypothetical protein ACQPW3_36225 [Actinosynnema sp. CA-248983]